MAARIFRRQMKKNVVKIAAGIHSNDDGTARTTKRWKRYQKTPVTWNGPRIRRDHPRSGAWGGLAPAGAATGGIGDSSTGGFYSDTPSISTGSSVRQSPDFK